MAKGGHCKNPDHLRVMITPGGTAQKVTATYQAKMTCENAAVSWGVVLSHKARAPLDGMHLLPAAVAWIPTQLRDAASHAAGAQTITISHTFAKAFVKFATLSPDGAVRLADDIDTQAAQH